MSDLTEREELLQLVSDMSKDAMGFRDRSLHELSDEELRAKLTEYSRHVAEDVLEEAIVNAGGRPDYRAMRRMNNAELWHRAGEIEKHGLPSSGYDQFFDR